MEVTPYYLQTLGSVALFDGSRRVRLPIRHHYALLVYLVFNVDRLIRRESLLPLLWGDRPDRAARHSLSQTIYGLRRLVPRLAIEVDRATIVLRKGSVTCDCDDILGSTCSTLDRDANDFLDGFVLGNGAGFDDWRDYVARDLRLRWLTLLRASILDMETAANLQSVVALSARFMVSDPYDEDVLRRQVTAIAASVSLTTAIDTLDRGIARIRLEVDREPAAHTLELRHRLLEGSRTPLSVGRRGGDDYEDVPFVGRSTEFVALRDLLTRAIAGTRSVVAVVGEAGIGKTRLCERLLRLAVITGARILTTKCHVGEHQMAFGAISGVLSGVNDGDLTDLSGAAVDALRCVMPIGVVGSVSRFATEPDGSAPRRRICEAFLLLIKQLSLRKPLVIMVDDLHLADPSSVEALAYLVRRTRRERILLLAVVRPEDLRQNLAVRDLLCYPEMCDCVMQLGDLAGDERANLLRAAVASLGVALPVSIIERIVRLAAGHPYYLIECCRHAAQAFTTAKGPVTPNDVGDSSFVPSSVLQLLAYRLDRMAPTQWRIAAALAVLGGEMCIRMLLWVARVGFADGMDALRALLEQRVLAVSENNGVRFAHDLVREATYQRLAVPERALLHLRSAAVLRRHDQTRPATLATHYYRGGDLANAFPFALKAADQNAALGAYGEVEHYLKLAVSSAIGEQDRYTADRRLALFLCETRRFGEAHVLLQQLSSSTLYGNDRSMVVASELASISIALGSGVVRIDELLERSRTVVRLADAASDQLSFVRVMRTLVSIAHGAGEAAFICALVDEIEARANSATDDVVAAELLALAANVGCVYKSMESAITYGDRAVALANACASPPTLATSLLARGIAQLTVGRVGDARIDFQQALSLAEANDLWAYRGQILTNLGIAEIELAEFAAAERSLLSVLNVAGRNESLFVWANLGALYWEIERWSQLRSVGIQLLSLSEALGVSWGVCVAESFRGLAAVGLGRGDEAAVAAGRVDRLLRSSIMVADVSYGAILIARVASARSLPRAVAYLESFRDCSSTAATLSRLRIELEIADLCVAFSPQRAWSVATAVRATGESLGATSVVARANRIREAVRYER